MLSYSEKFIAIRRQLRLSQDALAENTGVSGSAIGLIEQGKTKNPSAEVLAALASKLGINLDWLLLGKGEMFSSANQQSSHKVDDTVGLDSEHKQSSMPFLANRVISSDALVYNRRDIILEGPDPQKHVSALLSELSEMVYLFRYDDKQRSRVLKEYYEIITPQIFELASQGQNAHSLIYFWHYRDPKGRVMQPNLLSAWYIINKIPLGLYPMYPVLDCIIDFADPYRKIAVFIEEAAHLWDYPALAYQDEILSVYGWKVFRIPLVIAKVYEADLLPANLLHVYDEGAESEEQLYERRKWDVKLSRKTIDGFFYWLKKMYFRDELINSIETRRRALDSWENGVVTYYFDNDSEMLNKIVFGQTSDEWHAQNTGRKNRKSLREAASANQLAVLASLETLILIIRAGEKSQGEKFKFLLEHAFSEFSILFDNANKNRIRLMMINIERAVIEPMF
jgi:transcriptional regulator with XRE-family HTH domain